MDNMAEGSTDLGESQTAKKKQNKEPRSESNGHAVGNGSAMKSNGSSSHTNGKVIPFHDDPDSEEEHGEL